MSIYLDHAATTPLDPEIFGAMEPYLRDEFGNPSSIHGRGQRARMAVDAAREQVSEAIGAHPSQIVFTSGGTESDCAAIRGAVAGKACAHVVTTTIEHEAVLETCRQLERDGVAVTYVGPGAEGIVEPASILRALRPQTALVSVMHANNEIGTIQPIAEIAMACQDRGILCHTDAVQTVGAVPVELSALPADLLSLSAHKFYGPKGVGALYVRNDSTWRPQQHGGGQERNRRSGTENVAGIVGLGAAITKAVRLQDSVAERLAQMRDFLFDSLCGRADGDVNGSRAVRLPGNVNVSFLGFSGEALIMALDQLGVQASSGSACSSGSTEPSHVLQAIGSAPDASRAELRLTLGRENTWEEVRAAAEIITSTVCRLRQQASAPTR